MKDEVERAKNERNTNEHDSENQQVAKRVFPPKGEKVAHSSKSEGIKLKGCVMLATKSELAEICDNELPCYALICKDALFSLEDISSSLPPPDWSYMQHGLAKSLLGSNQFDALSLE